MASSSHVASAEAIVQGLAKTKRQNPGKVYKHSPAVVVLSSNMV